MAKFKKKDMGEGLKALFSNIDQKVKEQPEEVVRELSNTIAFVPVNQIEVNPFQPRKEFDENDMTELADSLKIHGLIQPVTVRRLNNTSYQLISGERRWRAAQLAEMPEIPAYIRAVEGDQQMLEMAIIENVQRKQLNAMEIAVSYQRLIDECDLTHEKVAERVGKNRTRVTNYLRLLKLPPDIQRALKLNVVSMGHAVAFAGVENILLLNSLFKETVDKSLSVRALEQLIKNANQPKKAAAKPSPLPSDYQNIQNKLRNYLEAQVEVKLKGKGKGSIIIHFDSDETLNDLLEKMEE
ncbi:MAG: ParB family chromosome partitioning protein [Saprospiraceae bacterium]|jgi:ParB family chromosome partitioning protein